MVNLTSPNLILGSLNVIRILPIHHDQPNLTLFNLT